MKKIFAFVLASIMVLSLVPASVFAAITNCPNVHTTENCPNHQVGDPVEPTCTKPGYTVYVCEDCGDEFLVDVKEPLGHDWDDTSDDDHENSDGKCTDATKKPKIEWVTCKREGCTDWKDGLNKCNVDDCPDDNECGLYFRKTTDPKKMHNYEPVANTGTGCELKYECSICEDEAYWDAVKKEYVDTAAHNWKYTATVVEPIVPTKDDHTEANGTAVFTCSVCKDTKNVTIMSQHTCDIKSVSGYVEPTCAENGKYAVYECKLCLDKFYYIEYFKDGKVDSKSPADLKYVDGSENVIKAVPGEHTKGDDWKLDPETCTWTGKCEECGKKNATVKEHTNVIQRDYLPATCANKGYKALFCTICGENWIEEIPAVTVHDSITYTIPSTCGKKGAILTLCTEPGCDFNKGVEFGTDYVGGAAGKNTYTFAKDEIVDGITVKKGTTYAIVKIVPLVANSTAHKPVKYYMTSTGTINCGEGGLYYYRCEYCEESLSEVMYDSSKMHDTYVYERFYTYEGGSFIEGYKLKCRNEGCNYEYDSRNYGTGKRVSGKAYFETLQEAMLYHGAIYLQYILVSEPGEEPEYEWVEREWKNYDWFIKNCNVITPAACDQNGYSAINACTCCGGSYTINVGKGPHPEYVPDSTTGSQLTYGKPSTCKDKGNIAYFTCPDCKGYWEWGKDIDNDGHYDTVEEQHNLTWADIEIPKHSDTAKLITVKDCTGKVVGSFYWCDHGTKTDDKINGTEVGKDSVFFSGEDKTESITKADALKIWALNGHHYSTLSSGSKATCGKDGAMKVEYCETCKTIKLTVSTTNTLPTDKKETYNGIEFVDRKYEFKNVTFNPEFFVASSNTLKFIEEGKTETTTISLVVAAHQHNDGDAIGEISRLSHKSHTGCDSTDALYTYMECSICDHAFIKDYVEQHEHVNKQGQILKDECANEVVTDRKCVVAKCQYNSADFKITAHDKDNEDNTLEIVEVLGNCVEEGYGYSYCTQCNHKIVTPDTTGKYSINKNTHKSPVVIDSNYAQVGYKKYPCSACEYEGEKDKAVAEAGVELLGSTVINGLEGNVATYGSVIELTVSLASLKGVEVWGVKFGVQYDCERLAFIEDQTTFMNSFTGTAADTDVTIPGSPMTGGVAVTQQAGVVSVVATTDANGKVITDSIEFVTLKFQVIYNSDVAEPNGFWFTIGEVMDSKYVKTYELSVIDTAGDEVNAIYDSNNNNLVTVDFAKLGELDNKSGMSLNDVQEMYRLIVWDDYSVAADLDANGYVDLADLDILYALITEKTTLEELYSEVSALDPTDPDYLTPAQSLAWEAMFNEKTPTWDNSDNELLLKKIQFFIDITGRKPSVVQR